MSRVTIVFGVLLVLVGGVGFVLTGSNHPTALIPSFIGMILVVSGTLAGTPDPKRRMLWMHVAVTIGFLGFLGTIKSMYEMIRLLNGVVYEHPIAIEEKAATCLLCLIFVALCVRSFVNARRSRLAASV